MNLSIYTLLHPDHHLFAASKPAAAFPVSQQLPPQVTSPDDELFHKADELLRSLNQTADQIGDLTRQQERR